MPVVSVYDAERFYLSMLLLRQPGAVGFEDIRTVDGIVCKAFQQACRMRGLLEGYQLWNDTLREAAEAQSPGQLRMLFAVVCAFEKVEDIPQLWATNRDALCEDFVHCYSKIKGVEYALAEINRLLQSF
ncbi:hypothetical protein JTE90_001625 [Oedothorax gibbosus]|uniref:Uncharacterized protein n=1 Tax=Oedothorax gibbosus TaxID=931172 RepID=A0AAV6VPN1_9ARAC|nr:hypothetical protein JTE90_001625 [Oedothorax gibbosus]